MAVTGPRVGSSAFAETGFREMSKARGVLRLPEKPGKLSEMIGRSKGYQITIGWEDGRRIHWDGYVRPGWPWNSDGGSGQTRMSFGSVSGDNTIEGHTINGPVSGWGGGSVGPGITYHLFIPGLKKAALRMVLTASNGATASFNLNYTVQRGADCYFGSDRQGIESFINSRRGKTINVAVSRR